MRHDAFSTSSSLAVGGLVVVTEKPIATGDQIAFQFANNSRQEGTVTASAPGRLEIKCDEVTWLLAPSDRVPEVQVSEDLNPTVWEIQSAG